MDFARWTLQDWTDAATILAAAGTLAAALVAAVAVVQARRLQDEKAQPYVVALVENNPNVAEMLELSFKNVGETAARDIQISFDPKPQRSAWGSRDKTEDLSLPATLPVLVPGQEWRTTWDSSHSRHGSGLPHRHEVTLTYTGLKGRKSSETYVIDWEHLYSRGYMEEKTVHHLAKDVHEMRRLFARAVGIGGIRGSLDVRVQQDDGS